jgi:hypothetical protein
MGNKSTRNIEQEKALEKEGVKFKSSNNKTRRLYFESQFSIDMEEDDIYYMNHIFELKVFLYFHQFYDKSHLIDTEEFLNETFDKLVDIRFSQLKECEIVESKQDIQSNKLSQSNRSSSNDKMISIRRISMDNIPNVNEFDEYLNKIFSFKHFYSNNGKNHNICIVNEFIQKFQDFPNSIDLPMDLVNKIKLTKELQIYNLLNDNTNIIYFALKKVLEVYMNNEELNKIQIFQVGLKTIDEAMYTIVADFLNRHPNITSVCFIGKTLKDIKHLADKLFVEYEGNENQDREEKLENEIHNDQHFFNFFQVLSKRTNLIELRILFFLDHYNFTMLSYVVLHNPNLKILQLRNMIIKENEMERELDFAFKELNDMGENLKDEIFIFFNYLFGLEYLEELCITHFWFNSEINLLACQTAQKMKYLKILSLERNQSLINNDLTALECFNLETTNLRKLDMGFTYFNMIRRFDYIINTDKLKEVNIGVLDFVSFAAFMKFLEKTNLEKVKVTLNKPTVIDSLPIFLNQVSDHPFKAINLKFLQILNAFTEKIIQSQKFKYYTLKLAAKMKENNTLRKLSFNKPSTHLIDIIENEDDRENGIRTFRYISYKKYGIVIAVIFMLKIRFNRYYNEVRGDNVSFNRKIIKRIVHFRFSQFRKITL